VCGPFTYGDATSLAALFEMPAWSEFPPRHNVAPTQGVPTVRWNKETAARELRWMRWGLVPSWAKDVRFGDRLFNARAETVATKPAFRKAFRERRCLIPADGFYEWKRRGKDGGPWYIRRKDQAPFAFAGLWEVWRTPLDDPLESCTIVTTTPNALMQPIHHRAPVILDRADFSHWLDPEFRDPAALKHLLVPWAPEEFEAFSVGELVNSARNDVDACRIEQHSPAQVALFDDR